MSHLSTGFGRRLAVLLACVPVVALTPVPAAALNPVDAFPDGIGVPTEMTGGPVPFAAAGDLSGSSVAVSGRWAVAGTPHRDNGPIADAGRASAYLWSPAWGWQFVRNLPINNAAANEQAGYAVAASADQLFVGVPQKNANGPGKMSGVVYVYHTTGSAITLEQTLSVNATDALGYFGRTIALDGDTMVVGAPGAFVGTTECGSVFVFKKGPTGWVQAQRIDPTILVGEGGFGNSVAIQASDLVVGQPGWGNNYGRVYTYRRNAGGTWIPAGEMSLTPPATQDLLGASVAVANGIMVAGAPGRDTSSAVDAGVAYVHQWTGAAWAQIADLKSPSPIAGESFGQAVAVSADTLLVSAPHGLGSGGATSGVVYHYTVDPVPVLPPTYKGVIYASSPGVGRDEFGSALAFDGDTMLAGAPSFDTVTAANAGAAWFFGGLRTARVRADRTLAVPMPGLLGNDMSADGTMTASPLSVPGHGIATVNASGAWTYDPTSWFIGTDTFRYRVTNLHYSQDSTVTVQVYPPATKTATAISIKTNLASVYYPKTFNLTGVLRPGAYLDPCVVYVKKPGSGRWSYSSARLAFSITPNVGANWWYRYAPKLKGTYAFKVNYVGDANRLASWSGVIYVKVK